MNRVFTIEQLRPIKDGMTISRDAKMGTATGVTFFSLGKDTSISQECYDATAVYIGAKGDATFLIGENADKKKFYRRRLSDRAGRNSLRDGDSNWYCLH